MINNNIQQHNTVSVCSTNNNSTKRTHTHTHSSKVVGSKHSNSMIQTYGKPYILIRPYTVRSIMRYVMSINLLLSIIIIGLYPIPIAICINKLLGKLNIGVIRIWFFLILSVWIKSKATLWILVYRYCEITNYCLLAIEKSCSCVFRFKSTNKKEVFYDDYRE